MITENRYDIFINQKFELTLRSHVDLTGGNIQLLITKPDGSADTHVVSITDITNGYTLTTFATNELDMLGLWQLKLYDTVTKVTGKIFNLYVNSRWER